MFEKHDVKDVFFDRVRAAASKLSRYPLDELRGASGNADDRQVFMLEQRALGEVLAVSKNGEFHCMGYADFLDKWDDAVFKKKLKPMIDFVDGLTPTYAHRWQRLELLSAALEDLRAECRSLLEIETNSA